MRDVYVKKLKEIKPYLGKFPIKSIAKKSGITNESAIKDAFRNRVADLGILAKICAAAIEIAKENIQAAKKLQAAEEDLKSELNGLTENFLPNDVNDFVNKIENEDSDSVKSIVKKNFF